MGMFKKLKDVLFDIEEEEIPVLTKPTGYEEKKVEKNPIKEIKIPEDDEFEPRKTEVKKYDFEDFDEPAPLRSNKVYDFEDYEEPVQKPKPIPERKESRNIFGDIPKRKDVPDYSKLLYEKKEVKPFKPSPVISPVYGILDQNYTKDDVIVKNDTGIANPNLDEVRKKAYGIKEERVEVKEDTDEFTMPIKTLDEILVEEPKHEVKKEPDPEIKKEEKIKQEIKEDRIEEKIEEPEEKENLDDTIETDLFNLIDSMYEEKEESEEE